MTQQPLIAYCVRCDARIRFHNQPELGDRVRCPECRRVLEVIRLRPLKLDWTDEPNDWSSDADDVAQPPVQNNAFRNQEWFTFDREGLPVDDEEWDDDE